MKRTKGLRGKSLQPIILSPTIRTKLLSQPHAGDLIALYIFYLHVSDYQNTNQPWATDRYCMKGLGWGQNRFYAAKKALVKLRLIEPIRDRKTTKNEFGQCYIKIVEKSHSMENNRVGEERAFVSNPSQDGMAPIDQKQALYGFQRNWKQQTNAYKERKNALNMTTPDGSSRKDEEIGSTNSKIDDPKLTESKVCPFGYKWGDYPKHKECHHNTCNKADDCDQASYLT